MSRKRKWMLDFLSPQQSSDKSVLVTLHCSLQIDMPRANLPPPTPIRKENQPHYSGQLANGLCVLCHYSRLIWFQSDDGAMSTQAARHSEEVTQKDERGGQFKINWAWNAAFALVWCITGNMFPLMRKHFTAFIEHERSVWGNLVAQQDIEYKWQLVMLLAEICINRYTQIHTD